MKKRMMLFVAGAVTFAGTAQNVFAEEETGGIKKIVEMITEAQEIRQGTVMVSLSMALGDTELSAGTTVSMMPDSSSVDMLYLSAPNDDGTFFDLVSEDVLRVFGTKAYLNTSFIEDVMSALEDEERLNEEDNGAVIQAVDSLSEDWIGLEGVEIEEEEPYSGWMQLLSGFAAAHDAGSYTINLGNDQIREILVRLDEQEESGTQELSVPFDLSELLTPYLNAIIEGQSEAESEAHSSEASEEMEESDAYESEIDSEDLFNQVNDALSEYAVDKTKPLAEQFDEVVAKGLVVDASICVGKDGAAGTYAFELTIEADIPKELQEEWGIENLAPIVGESEGFTSEPDEEETKNVMVSFVVSVEPSEEPIEIEEPEENVLWLTDLLREWAAQGLF